MPINQNIGQIIIETAPVDMNAIESKTKIVRSPIDGRSMAITVLQDANNKNRNGRFYEDTDLFPALKSARIQELQRNAQMKAEQGHPMSKDLARQRIIDPDNTVAIFPEFWTEGQFVMGRVYGDWSVKGEYFDKELKAGGKPSWSLRALGKIVQTARGAEVKNLNIITYDRVINPSHACAYTQSLLESEGSEGFDYYNAETSKLYLEENDMGMVIPITNASVINYIKEESSNIKSVRESFDMLFENIELVNRGTQIQLTDNQGSIIRVNLEQYIKDDIMEHCIRK